MLGSVLPEFTPRPHPHGAPSPRPDRRLRSVTYVSDLSVTHVSGCAPAEPTVFPSGEPGSSPPQASARRCDSAEPLTVELSRLHVTVSKRFLDKLEAARAALSHVQPGATTEEILEAGLDLLLRRHAARRGLVEKPRQKTSAKAPPKRTTQPTTSSAPKAPALSALVKRQVWTRDGGRCQWPLESGGTCQSPLSVEYDHIIPRALGGSSTAKNIRLLCRFHNDLAARRTFGDRWMNQFTRVATAKPVSGTPSAEEVT